MNKMALITLLGLSLGANAAPLVNGPYLALRGGADFMHFSSDADHGNKTTFALLIAAGLRVKSLRAEFEWANSSHAHIKNTEFEQQRYMAQFYYDFPLRSVFRPYLNLGVGAAYTDTSYKRFSTYKRKDDTSFAWNGGAGIGLNLTRAWSFDLGYRYIDSGKFKAYDSISVRNRNHEAYFGSRFTF